MNQFLLCILFCFVCSCSNVLSQEFPDSIVNGEHAVILKEVDRITVSGNKAAFIFISLHKQVKVKILDKEGLNYYSNLDIPQLHDPFAPKQAPEIHNLQSNLQSASIKDFKYWVNGEKQDSPKASHQEILRVLKKRFIASDLFKYHPTGLNVGDVLVFEYTVEAPYPQNWEQFLGYRIFFHGVHPKLDYSFRLTIPSDLVYDLYSINDAAYRKTEKDGYVEISVNETNLKGCADEIGARPYLDLPHLAFQPKPYEWLYLPYYSQFGKFMPFHISSAQSRENNAWSILNKFRIGENSPSMNAIRKYIESNSKNENAFDNFLDMHNDIVRNFEFLDDRDYLAQYDTRKTRIGEHVQSKKLRNIARFDTYRYLMAGLNLMHNTIYPCDNRYGQLGQHYYVPMRTNDYLFVVAGQEQTRLIYPKRAQFGYYANELPFYFENTIGIRMAIDDINLRINTDYEPQIDYVKVPGLNASNNGRKIYGQIKVNSNGAEQISSRVSLTGQFSTTGRHSYKGEGIDHTINPMYGLGPHNIGEAKVDITKEDMEPPFGFNCSVISEHEFAHLNDQSLELNLTGLFPHIMEESKMSLPRNLKYYVDFPGSDIIRYQVQLDGNFELEKAPSFSIKNGYGEFVFQVQMNSPNTLLISSSHTVMVESVLPENFQEVIDIQDAIREASSGKVVLKKI